jgi:tetratricopeptide (TPR) repeat protein
MDEAASSLSVVVGRRLHLAGDALDFHLAPATDGDIAAINLESARQQSWSQFWRAPTRPGTAELIVEQEQLTAQFVGDLAAFDRLGTLADEFARAAPETGRAALIAGQVAGATHRFAEARRALAQAAEAGAAAADTERLVLAFDQATGANLPAVLAVRRERAAQPGRWAELVPLGALLVDMGEFGEADHTYLRALREYPDVSPFALGWVCFQLGALWGECVPTPEPPRAAQWYRRAIDYLPCYVKARVHLAESLLDDDDLAAARELLLPVVASGDPEVPWRLADVASATGNDEEAASQLAIARAGFEALLTRHPLAFADHAAEFYLGSGDDVQRALHLARLNLDNRPTARAFDLYAAASDRCGASTCPTAEHS